jgi:glycosyltransferase involved in cell wall biosynthesis
MLKPAVTVLIDTYNHERFIEEAIVSVLEQDFPAAEKEILVVDDGSPDRTPEIVRKFEPHVRLLRKENGGQASAFNAGIPEARGEIVALLDGDDWWAKEKPAVVTDYLAGRPHIGIVGHGIYEVDSGTNKTSATIPQHAREISFDTVSGGTFFSQMMCFFGTSRVTIRWNVLDRVLPIPEPLVVEADEFLSIMSAAYSAAGLIQQPLTFYACTRIICLRSARATTYLVRVDQNSDGLAYYLMNIRKHATPARATPTIVDASPLSHFQATGQDHESSH